MVVICMKSVSNTKLNNKIQHSCDSGADVWLFATTSSQTNIYIYIYGGIEKESRRKRWQNEIFRFRSFQMSAAKFFKIYRLRKWISKMCVLYKLQINAIVVLFGIKIGYRLLFDVDADATITTTAGKTTVAGCLQRVVVVK